jgi:hypothetical protein
MSASTTPPLDLRLRLWSKSWQRLLRPLPDETDDTDETTDAAPSTDGERPADEAA